MPSSKAHLSGNEETLIRQAAQLRDAFGKEILAHREYLFALCFGLLRDRDKANDIVQATLARAITECGSYTDRASIKTWLWNMAYFDCRNVLQERRHKIKGAISMETAVVGREEEGAVLADFIADPHSTPEEIVLDKALFDNRGRLHKKIVRRILATAACRDWDLLDYQVLFLYIPSLRAPTAPRCTFGEIGRMLGENDNTLRDHWNEHVRPLLKEVLQHEGIGVPN